jgi:hypothetical protein
VSGATQLVNVRRGHYGYQGSQHSHTPQYWEPPYLSAHNRAHPFSSTPASPCTSIASRCTSSHSSLSSLSWSDSVRSSPTQHHPSSVQQEHSSNDFLSGLQLLSAGVDLCTPPRSVPSMASPVSSQAEQQQHWEQQHQPPLEVRAPTPPTLSVPTSPVPDSTPQDLVGRRAPKRRRIARAVQPLACFFCRGRKIACGPPTSSSNGDRTCEYVVNSFL